MKLKRIKYMEKCFLNCEASLQDKTLMSPDPTTGLDTEHMSTE